MKKNEVAKTAGIVLLIISGYVVYSVFAYQKNVETASKSGVYPEAFKSGYMQSCEATEEQCKCSLNYYERNFTYGEYLELLKDDARFEESRVLMLEECL